MQNSDAQCLQRGSRSISEMSRVIGLHEGLLASTLAACKTAVAVLVQSAWRVLVCMSCVIKHGPAMAFRSI